MAASKVESILLPATAYKLTDLDIARFTEEQDTGMVAPSASVLNDVAMPVAPEALNSAPIRRVIERLYEAANGQRRHAHTNKARQRTLVGLAAPQIGESCRIILIDTKVSDTRRHTGKLECFINPEIVWRSHEMMEGREGCFSAGPVWGLVRRPVAVKIRALTPEGKQVERIFEDFTARVACHEIDHLQGIRFPERIHTDRKRHWVHTEELSEYPTRVLHWHRLCSVERWEAFKRGDIL